MWIWFIMGFLFSYLFDYILDFFDIGYWDDEEDSHETFEKDKKQEKRK